MEPIRCSEMIQSHHCHIVKINDWRASSAFCDAISYVKPIVQSFAVSNSEQ